MSDKIMRKIIKIDEEKCDGCGICADACHEGAIRIIDGKAKLVSESYCDGLGDCIGECPRGAISFEMREAAAYDEEAVKQHMAAKNAAPLPCGCPGTMARDLRKAERPETPKAAPCACSGGGEEGERPSELGNWPVQLRLVPENAPYLRGAKIVMAADCTPFAFAGFHERFLAGGDKVCLVGCPKLDDAGAYMEKLARIIALNEPEQIHVIYMEVPCCGGLVRLVEEAVDRAKKNLVLRLTRIGIQGNILEDEQTRYRFGS